MKVTEKLALSERLLAFEQVPSAQSLSGLPPYVECFLAHLRLLVGVPFTYLVADARLLPDESIRFFYIDRSWTDRLVDGALAVGKVGTRELAHLQAHAPGVQQSADVAERLVRRLQRGKIDNYVEARQSEAETAEQAQVITGLLLRSALISGWPHLEVRAFADQVQLRTLRLERLSGGVLIALFEGVPDRVELEEPHHGVQFGVDRSESGSSVTLRDSNGRQIKNPSPEGPRPIPVAVPMRPGNRGVLNIAALRRALHQAQQSDTRAMQQKGSAALALSVLDPPYRQPFGESYETDTSSSDVAGRVQDVELEHKLRMWVKYAR